MNLASLLSRNLYCSLAAAVFFLLPALQLKGECKGKIDLAPAYIHIDVIESKNTVKELDMAGGRIDLSVVIGKGWTIKPTVIYGKESDGELVSYGIGFGRCIPYGKCWHITPMAGINYTTLGTSIHLEIPQLGEFKFKERFKGYAPYIGLEVIYSIAPNLRICLNGTFAWSRSKTEIKHLFSSKGHAQGPSYGAMLEYDLNRCWSVNIGGAYNESYSEEKDGLRARGLKIGIARWF